MYLILTVSLSVQMQQQAVEYSAPGAGPMPGENYITAQRILYSRGRCVHSDHGQASRRLAYRTPGAGPMPGEKCITAQRILYSRGRALLAQPDPGQAHYSQRRSRLE